MRLAHVAALDFEAALHNYRRDPSPDNLRALMRCGQVVCTLLRQLDEQLERALRLLDEELKRSSERERAKAQVTEQLELEREKVPRPRELCGCGGRFRPQTHTLAIWSAVRCRQAITEVCDCCSLYRLTAFYGEPADAG